MGVQLLRLHFMFCVCKVYKNNNYKLYDFTKISLFISYKENHYNIIYNNLVKRYELIKDYILCFVCIVYKNNFMILQRFPYSYHTKRIITLLSITIL